MNKEQLRMQMLAGIITESQYKAKLNEMPQDLKISFGPFKNIPYYFLDNKVNLLIDGSDNFKEIEDSLEYETDEFTEEQISFLNDKMEELAQDMSDYLSSINIQNDIYDNQIGYGQEIDNLVVVISKEDLPKVR